jgi:hypothetical protein
MPISVFILCNWLELERTMSNLQSNIATMNLKNSVVLHLPIIYGLVEEVDIGISEEI